MATTTIARRDFKGMERLRLRAAGRAGRKPKLGPRQRHKLERALLQGALAHGSTRGVYGSIRDGSGPRLTGAGGTADPSPVR